MGAFYYIANGYGFMYNNVDIRTLDPANYIQQSYMPGHAGIRLSPKGIPTATVEFSPGRYANIYIKPAYVPPSLAPAIIQQTNVDNSYVAQGSALGASDYAVTHPDYINAYRSTYQAPPTSNVTPLMVIASPQAMDSAYAPPASSYLPDSQQYETMSPVDMIDTSANIGDYGNAGVDYSGSMIVTPKSNALLYAGLAAGALLFMKGKR